MAHNGSTPGLVRPLMLGLAEAREHALAVLDAAEARRAEAVADEAAWTAYWQEPTPDERRALLRPFLDPPRKRCV